MPAKYLKQIREYRRKRTEVQKAREWMNLEVIGSLPQHYFHCTCCGGIIEHGSAHLNRSQMVTKICVVGVCTTPFLAGS